MATNREAMIKGLETRFGEIQKEKYGLLREIWKLEYEAETIKQKLLQYGRKQNEARPELAG